MQKIRDTFGMSRVVEPIGAVPVTAWRVDNSREIGANECRINVTSIYVEPDSFQQICHECTYDDVKVKAKIIDIVNRRGKLHNPFTESGGVFCGTVEEMGEEYEKTAKCLPGTEILCNTTTTALPLHIEEIKSINYSCGEILITGYCIIFEDTAVMTIGHEINKSYTMAIMNESGSLYNLYNLATPGMNVLIISNDLISTIVYINLLKLGTKGKCSFSVIIDSRSVMMMPEEQAKRILNKYTDSVFIVDISKPFEAANTVMDENSQLYDLVINCENTMGSETLAVFLTKDSGQLYFSSVRSNHTHAVLAAESMGKKLKTYPFDQNLENHENFIMDLILSIKNELDSVWELYENLVESSERIREISEGFSEAKARKADDFIFASSVTQSIVDEALNIAGYDCNVILQGETGTGKEKILSLIHKNSARNTKPCVKINCATIQESLAESEFFGYEKGSFTGAQEKGKKGYFDMANGGILFLDEIGALSLNLQSKLLRVLQEGQFYRVGGTEPVDINVRVICANNVPIRQLVEEGKFREDLYYRLNICTLEIPPLRERKEDISALAEAFIGRYCKMYGTDKIPDAGALRRLAAYDWPGNVRELENLIHRLIINVKSSVIRYEDVEKLLGEAIYEDLVIDLKHKMRNSDGFDFNRIIEEQEKQLISYAMKKCGTTRKAADFLNMTQAQLMRKKQKYLL